MMGDDLYTALVRLKGWAEAVMYDSKPNSNRYDVARGDREWADRKLRELQQRQHP